MFEILENLNVLHSQISPEKDNSKVTIFKVNLGKTVLSKIINLILKFHNGYFVRSSLLYVYSNNWAYLLDYFIFNVLFGNLARIKCLIISINSRLFENSYRTLFLRYFLIFDLVLRSILYITRKGVEK